MKLRNWFRASKTNRTSQRTLRCRLAVEVLEDRCVPTAVAAPSNLVSWWTANNSAVDVMGLNNATLYGTTYTTGEVGQAFNFNGVSNRAQIADSSSLALTASMTIEGWVNVRGFPTGTNGDDHGEILFRGDDRGGLDPYSLSVEPNGTLNFQVTDATNSSATLAAPIATGQFIHVAGTLDNATGTESLFENGVLVAQQVTTIRPFQNLDPASNPSIAIGNHGGYPTSPHNFPFNGLIDELSMYNRALSPGEVLGIDKAGSSGKVLSPIAVDSPSVVDGSGGATTPVTFTITRTGSLTGSLTVNWATADDTAIAGTDYVAASGTVTFADGQATQTVQVMSLDSNVPKPNVDFKLIATPVSGTSIMGLATIVNDDASISVGSASVTEGSNSLKFLDQFVANGSGGLARSRSSVFGPDGNLYVASADTNAILRYNATGEFMDAFVPSGSGGLNSPLDLTFGPDGNLYVSSFGNNEVLSYDGLSGAFLSVVTGGLSSPDGITFGSDGSLYIANTGTNEVLRYNNSGLSSFVTAGSGGLNQPYKAVFGPDGNLYVSSKGTGQVLRYNGQTGAFVDVFATTGSTAGPPVWLEFGTDGYLYVSGRTLSSSSNMSIFRFNAATGALVDAFALGWNGWSFNLGPGNVVYVSANGSGGFVDRVGPSSIAAFTVTLASASGGTTTVSYATADGTALAGRDYTAVSGTLTFAPGETVKGILVPTLDDGVADPTKDFIINLSNPVGGSITAGQGVGTILDDTKFYVVDGSASDRTYQYASAGAALGNNTLSDTAPRGVATTAAGTTEWVVDANKNVYVYSTGGALLGSWSASGLSSSAKLTGIATNGTDIWLVDSYADKVYKYTGAASRLSGSQSAASSFSLATAKHGSRNSNPQDIVTDGTSFWVVDGSALKVFKYSLSGSSLGSWSIDPANAHPTGITINPSNVSDIWIVDSGTLKVYQYTAAAARTSGSQSAAATFALAPGDTNPQGIADPPPASVQLTPVPAAALPALPPVAAFNLTPSSGPSAVAGVAAPTGSESVFAMMYRQSVQMAGELSQDVATMPTPAASVFAGNQPVGPLTLASQRAPSFDGNDVGLLDGIWAGEASPATTDYFAMLADDVAEE